MVFLKLQCNWASWVCLFFKANNPIYEAIRKQICLQVPFIVLIIFCYGRVGKVEEKYLEYQELSENIWQSAGEKQLPYM